MWRLSGGVSFLVILLSHCWSAVGGTSVAKHFSIREFFTTRKDPFQASVDLIEKHYVHQDFVRTPAWKSFVANLSSFNNSTHRVSELIKGLNDPYAMYLNPAALSARRNALQSVSTYCGFLVRRRFRPAAILDLPFHCSKKSVVCWSTLLGTAWVCCRAVPPPQRVAVLATISCGAFFANNPVNLIGCLIEQLYPIEVSRVDVDGGSGGSICLGDHIIQVNGEYVRYHSTRQVNALLNRGDKGSSIQVLLKRPIRLQARQPLVQNVANVQQLPSQKISTLTKLNQILRKRNSWRRREVIAHKNEKPREPAAGSVFNVTFPIMLQKAAPSIERCVLPQSCGPCVGYMRIKEFHDDSYKEFSSALHKLEQDIKQMYGDRMQALVLDVRGNPGGSLSPALDIAAMFLPPGTCLIRLQGAGRIESPTSQNSAPNMHTAILFLTDSRTASASEILVEALCDNRRAFSMGKRTKGKNYAQIIIGLSDGSGICFSIRQFFSPSGRELGTGHTPLTQFDAIDRLKRNRIRFMKEPSSRMNGWSVQKNTIAECLEFC